MLSCLRCGIPFKSREAVYINEVKAPYGDTGEPSKTWAQPLIFSARGQGHQSGCQVLLSVLWCNPTIPWLLFHSMRKKIHVLGEQSLFNGVAGESKATVLGTDAEFWTQIFPQVFCPDLLQVCPQGLEPGLVQPPWDKCFCSGHRSILELESGSRHPKERKRQRIKKPQLL